MVQAVVVSALAWAGAPVLRHGRLPDMRLASSPIMQHHVPRDAFVTVDGGSLVTWQCTSQKVEEVQMVLKTGGRPLDADVEVWNGPGNSPCRMRVYVEDGLLRPFSAVLATPGLSLIHI